MTEERMRMLIQAELAGEIGMAEEAELQQALAENSVWQTVYAEERALSRLLAADRGAIVPPEGLAERIADRILADAPAGRGFDFARWTRVLAVAASIVLVVGVSFWSGSKSTSAGIDRTHAGLIERRNELLESSPAADREAILRLFDQAISRLRDLDQRHESERSRILEDLENEIGDRIGDLRKR